MSYIIYDSRLIKTLECLKDLAAFAGKDDNFVDKLWSGLSENAELMNEFIYYLENHTFKDKYKIHGYGLTDLYFFNMRNFEIKQDLGKDYGAGNKESLALDTFMMMIEMKSDPDRYLKWLDQGPGMDRFFD